jgi:hypothetical protein
MCTCVCTPTNSLLSILRCTSLHIRPAHHLHYTQMSSLLDRVSDAVEVHALPPILGWEDVPEVGLADALAGLGLQNAHLFIPTALDTAEDFIA